MASIWSKVQYIDQVLLWTLRSAHGTDDASEML